MNKNRLLVLLVSVVMVMSIIALPISATRVDEAAVPRVDSSTNTGNGGMNTIQIGDNSSGKKITSQADDKKSDINWTVIAIAAASVVVVGGVTFFVITLSKKKKPSRPVVDNRGYVPNMDTVAAKQVNANNHYLILTDMNNPRRVFSVLIEDRVTIGRVDCDINIIDDILISNVQCEIKRRGELYSINDLNSVNGTKYDSFLVYGDTPVMTGGMLEIGHQRFRISFAEKKPPVIINSKTGEAKSLQDSQLRIGSSANYSNYILDSQFVSKQHADIIAKNGRYFVRDLESRNGTYVNGVRIAPNEMVEIISGTRINIADIELLFKIEEKEI